MAKLHCLLAFAALFIASSFQHFVNGDQKVRCFFIFGDSLVDAGNNNNLNTSAKVNYIPYGADFFNSTATGRFTNGLTPVDLLAQFMGFKDLIPPFATATDDQIMTGVNYASGSSGILPETGKHMGANVDLSQQLNKHLAVKARIAKILGNNSAATEYLSQCIYVVATGNSDYTSNYFLPSAYNTSKTHTPLEFGNILIKKFYDQLRMLYNMGARKVGVSSIQNIGCTPNATATYPRNGTICVDKMNHAANIFNRKLPLLMTKLNLELDFAQFVKIGCLGFDVNTAFPGNVTMTSCCPPNDLGLCSKNQVVCRNRDFTLFWDSFHPSETVYKITTALAYSILKNLIF